MTSLRNSLRPVNRLPPDIITTCASFVSDADPRPIVSLTHVCRYWRRSITSNPRSWAWISTGWKRLAPLCFERAGTVPLTVDITVSDIKSGENLLESLLPQISRICCLRLTGYSSIEAVVDDLPGFFDSSMPNLTSLELQQTMEPTTLFPSSEAPQPPVFRNVERLESLSLTRTPLYPALLSITSLKELKLLKYTTPFHFGTLLELLDSNPSIERVVLDIQFIADSVETAPARATSLPRLRHLSITCSEAIDAKGLLSCISLPQGTRLEVSCSQWTPLGSCLPSPPTPIQKVLVPAAAVRFKAAPWEIHAFGRNGSFSFRCPQLRSIGEEFHLFLSASVRELHVNIAPWLLTPAFSTSMLTQLPGLEILVVADANSWATGTFDSLAGQPPLCPSLKTIAFFDCGFTPEAMRELGGVAAKRKGTAAAWLYRVVIVNSTGALPHYTFLQQLQQHVPCVDVRVSDKLPDLS